MDRREFVTAGAAGIASLALGATASPLSWLGNGMALAAEESTPWKFGVMCDTQWKANVDGKNPGTCAVDIINRLNARFIQHGVKFVIQVGDLVDVEYNALNGAPSERTLPYRAAAAQALYDAGIGFYPCRGNHEGSSTAANEFIALFPQTRGVGARVSGATGHDSPSIAGLNGLSYSFDFGNVRFVLLDQFTRTDGTNYLGSSNNNTIDQLPWIDGRLGGRESGTHAFVFSHKNLIGQNHVDTLFGTNPASNPDARNTFIKSLAANGVRYQIGGHDHMHHRSIVGSPDGTAAVRQLICASDSYKFYTPPTTSNDASYDHPTVEQVLAQELYSIGYYIFTVDGPRLTVDFYSSAHGSDYGDVDLVASPTGTVFYKRESWGYSLNGREFVIAEGGAYTDVDDAFGTTRAAIVSGTNGGTATDRARRAMVKTVNTGWTPQPVREAAVASNVLHLWGIADSLALWDDSLTGLLPSEARTDHADTFTLAMSYDQETEEPVHLGNGGFGIATKDDNGDWVNAVALNAGGTKRFVLGAWGPEYGLGTYGVDPSTKTAWAVVNHEGQFAVARGIDLVPGQARKVAR